MPITLSSRSVFLFLRIPPPHRSLISPFNLISPNRYIPLITNVISFQETDYWISTASLEAPETLKSVYIEGRLWLKLFQISHKSICK
jgi:hypothetical protein